jgi:hypothetical protein
MRCQHTARGQEEVIDTRNTLDALIERVNDLQVRL